MSGITQEGETAPACTYSVRDTRSQCRNPLSEIPRTERKGEEGETRPRGKTNYHDVVYFPLAKLAAQSESKVSSKKRKRLEKYIVRQARFSTRRVDVSLDRTKNSDKRRGC
jgi:hypothetical protein